MNIILFQELPPYESCVAVAVYSSIFFTSNPLNLINKERFLLRMMPLLFHNGLAMYNKWKAGKPKTYRESPTPQDFLSFLELSTPTESMYRVGLNDNSESKGRHIKSDTNGLKSVLNEASIHSSTVVVLTDNYAVCIIKLGVNSFIFFNQHKVKKPEYTELSTAKSDPGLLLVNAELDFLVGYIGNLWGNTEFACIVFDTVYIKNCRDDVISRFTVSLNERNKYVHEPSSIGDSIESYENDEDEFLKLIENSEHAESFIDAELKNAICTNCMGNGMFHIFFVILLLFNVLLLAKTFFHLIM